jgi:hypothetical protein
MCGGADKNVKSVNMESVITMSVCLKTVIFRYIIFARVTSDFHTTVIFGNLIEIRKVLILHNVGVT